MTDRQRDVSAPVTSRRDASPREREVHDASEPSAPFDAKEAAIIAAARTVFLANGFDGASMDAIALTANVSKRTVYNRFASKEQLFGAAIEETCRRVLPVDIEAAERGTTPREFVQGLSRAFLRAILDKEAIALRRIATFESSRKPELGRAYLENGLYFMVEGAANIVARLQSRGVVRPDADPELAVHQLGALITEPLYSEMLLGAPPGDIDAAIDEQLANGLDAFWRLYGVPSSENVG
ncbi:MAG: TetR family transcriptional regulator [Alphaproteobacteria bacterium]|nr:TetR family transcriptional regulator [Alphaproteobacteria bacterium]